MIGRSLRIPISACVVLAMSFSPVAHAERLAARRYTTADGLPGDYILSVTRDTRGFLWFSTRDGLSRFDGVRFVSYDMTDGLSNATVNHLLQARDGRYWISTNGGGLCRMNPLGQRPPAAGGDALFERHSIGDTLATNRVNLAFEDRAGALWVGTDYGLYRSGSTAGAMAFERVDLPFLPDDVSRRGVGAIAEDADGSLWIGGGFGIARRLPGGGWMAYEFVPQSARDGVDFIQLDERRRLWAGLGSGLLRLDYASPASLGPSAPAVRRVARTAGDPARLLAPRTAGDADDQSAWFTTAEGLPDNHVSALHRSSDGRWLVGTVGGLSEFDGRAFRPRGPSHGMSDSQITDITTDATGSLWLVGVTGAIRIARHGLISYDRTDGLPQVRVHSIGQDAAGRLFVIAGNYLVSVFDGTRFTSVRPQLPAGAQCMWMSKCGHLDRTGTWWFPTRPGLFAWSTPAEALAREPPDAVYTSRNGLPDDVALNAYEDRHGDLWVGTAIGGLARRDGATGRWHVFTEGDGLPPVPQSSSQAIAFAEDRAGALWIGFEQAGVARFRGGRFERFLADQEPPLGAVTAIHADAAGRIWIASTQGGLRRVDDPAADRPAFVALGMAQGLASDNVRSLTDDHLGRLYAGTSRGISRLDTRSGAIRQFSVSDGLASDFVTAAFRDHAGALWFGTMIGVSRLDPAADTGPPAGAPPVFIATVRAGGVPVRLNELGDAAPAPITVAPDRNQLEIGFFGFSFESGEPLKYQFRLEGTDREWSAPTDVRTVNYARLAPGSYRFVVRAVRPDGLVSAAPASVAFTVLPPFYATWWFITLACLGLGAIGLVLYRARVAQLLRVERVRARIATDLHDDIGASLSQISILAEVARQRLQPLAADRLDADATAPLARIAETSRTLVDSMSDIVWAINPDVDSLSDLVHRMRRFVEDTLGAADLDLTFSAPDPSHDLKLGADVRREVFLVLKESVTNIAKHAQATRVDIELQVERRRLRLRVADDGRGFDPAGHTDGNGVASMRRRVQALGGHLVIDSRPGAGTTIGFDIEATA